MSRRLHEYLTLKKERRPGWNREYEDSVSDWWDGDKNAFLAGWYSGIIDELLDELPEKEVARIIDRLAERMTSTGEVTP